MLGTNLWKYWYWSKFSKNFVFSQNFENLEFVKFSEILSIFVVIIIPYLVTIRVNPDLYLWKLTKNHDFSEILWKISNLFSILGKISTSEIKKKKYRCLSKYSKLLILVKKIDFGKFFRKSQLWSSYKKKIENQDFGQNFQKSCLITNFLNNLKYGQNFRKILIFFRNCKKSWLHSKFLKFSIVVQKIVNLTFGQKLPKISTLVKFF